MIRIALSHRVASSFLVWWVSATTCAVAHTHIEVRAVTSGLKLVLYDFDEGDLDPAVVPVRIGAAAIRTVPAHLGDLLGPIGSRVWILPQHEDPQLPFFGIGAGSIPSGRFRDDQLSLVLRRVEGPGDVVAYQVQALGDIRTLYSSRDHLPDSLKLRVGAHLHCNWAFTAPGTYRTYWYAAGVSPDGSIAESEETMFRFEVIAPPAPVLSISRTADGVSTTVSIDASYPGPARLEASSDLVNWRALTNFAAGSGSRRITLPQGETCFVRAVVDDGGTSTVRKDVRPHADAF
jgi:surface-anchored protein